MYAILPAVLLMVAALGIALAVFQAEQRRRRELAAFAMSRGWTYSHLDVYGLPNRWSGPPFGQGHGLAASNVVEGSEHGRPFISFDYTYQETTSNGKSSSTTTYNFHVTALRMPAPLPPLFVGRESVLTRLGGALGLQDIALESDEFNRRFRVHAHSRKFAHDVLHPRTMEALLQADCPAFRIEGVDVVMWSKGKARPDQVVRHLSALRSVVQGVPSFVWKDHGYDPGNAGASLGGHA